MLLLEYRDHGEWAVTVRRADIGLGGEWSVTAENRLGSSTRDWRLRLRQAQIQLQQTSQEAQSRHQDFYKVSLQNVSKIKFIVNLFIIIYLQEQPSVDTISDKEDIKIKKTKEILPNPLEKRSIATKEANKSKTMESRQRVTNGHDSIICILLY